MIRRYRTKFKDVTGQIRHKLTARWPVGYQNRADGGRRVMWLFSCECGQTITYPVDDFMRGRLKSCGCLRMREDAPMRSLFAQYRHKAKSRSKEWSLTFEQFKTLAMSPCFYTGRIPQQRFAPRRLRETLLYNGIDRRDNTKGYTVENSVSCWGPVNKAKLDMSEKDFISMCRAVADRFQEEVSP